MGGHLGRAGWDPEGLLSTVPAVATTLFGVVCGLCLASGERREPEGQQIAAAGAGGVVGGHLWGVVFPINKSLWSSSFAVFSAGAASLLLALCYWAIEVKGWRRWTKPFAILGANALTLYMASTLLRKTLAPSASRRLTAGCCRSVSISTSDTLRRSRRRRSHPLYALANLLLLSGLLA